MKTRSMFRVGMAMLAGLLSFAPLVSTRWVEAQTSTPTATIDATTPTTVSPLRTPTVRTITATPSPVPVATRTVVAVATRGIAASQPVTPGELGRDGTITVDGIGQISAIPDAAVIELGVQNRAITASVALSETAIQMTALLDMLADQGVASADIQTLSVSLYPVYEQSQTSTDQSVLVGFNAQNIVRVRVRNINNLGRLLDTAIETGVNTIQSVQLELSNPASLFEQARTAAVNDARQKAEQLAVLTGTELGAIRSVVESGHSIPIALPEAMAGSRSVPIAGGTTTVQVMVQITWQVR